MIWQFGLFLGAFIYAFLSSSKMYLESFFRRFIPAFRENLAQHIYQIFLPFGEFQFKFLVRVRV